MITIFHPSDSADIPRWKQQLDRTLLKYEFIVQDDSTEVWLVDDDKTVNGVTAIEAYIDNLEQFVKGWYEDRCDRYDFLD